MSIEDGVVLPKQLERELRLVSNIIPVDSEAHLDLGLEGVEPGFGVRIREGDVRLDATLLQHIRRTETRLESTDEF